MQGRIHRNALSPEYPLHWYTIERILGQGGFGITYLATDTNLAQKVAIKEYLPTELAMREGDHSVHPVSSDHDAHYRWGLERFIGEARALAQFDHPNICRVLAVFEANNTAYMVMRYEQGEALSELLTRRGTLAQDEVLGVLFPLLEGLEKVHERGFIHRDIKPPNVYLRTDKTPVLLDFGSARRSLGEETKTLTTLVSPGYAPFEQYHAKSDQQGPWTDIYGLAATTYRALSGKTPLDALERSTRILARLPDEFPWAASTLRGRYDGKFLEVLDRGLRFDAKDRPQSVTEWREAFLEASRGGGGAARIPTRGTGTTGVSHVAASDSSSTQETLAMAPAEPPPVTRRHPARTAAVVAVLGLLLAAGWLAFKPRSGPEIAALTPSPSVVEPGQEAIESAQSPPGEALPDELASAERVSVPEPEPSPPPQTKPDLAAEEPPPTTPPEETRDERIARLLSEAQDALGRQRLTTPAGDNAFERYWEVLKMDPENEAALGAVRGLVRHYIERALTEAQGGNRRAAEEHLDKLLLIVPGSEVVARAKRRLGEN